MAPMKQARKVAANITAMAGDLSRYPAASSPRHQAGASRVREDSRLASSLNSKTNESEGLSMSFTLRTLFSPGKKISAGNMAGMNAMDMPFASRAREFGTRAVLTNNGSWDGGEQMADEMIRYSEMNRLKGCAEAIRVLEHGLSFLVNDGKTCATSAGRVLLALSSLHTDRANFDDAFRVLEQASTLEGASPEVQVAAGEAHSGLSLRRNNDAAAIRYATNAVQVATAAGEKGWDDGVAHALRSRAFSALAFAEHLRGNVETAERIFVEANSFQENFNEDFVYGSAAAVLADAEHCHSYGRLSHASVLYERALHLARQAETGPPYLAVAAAAMAPKEVIMGSLAGLGQLEAHSGDFEGAEKRLTESLNHAEQISGDKHIRVGAVLSTIAHVYNCRAKARSSGDRIVAEGLYRRSLELLGVRLQAEPEEASDPLDMAHLKSLTQARLAEVVGLASNRSSEAERLMESAKRQWRGLRPLEEVLAHGNAAEGKHGPLDLFQGNECASVHRYSVIDVRLGRIFA